MIPASTEKEFSNPYVFVVGCPRSGTTLLQRMLDAHPRMAIAKDTHFIVRAAKKFLRTDPNPALSEDLVERVYSYHRFYRMGLEKQDVLDASRNCKTYSAFVSRLYTIRAAHLGKTISGEKTPDYCRKIPVLHRLFPRARFIHIIRDGRDTALSALDWANAGKGPGKWPLWASDPLGTCALWWRWQAGTGRRDGALLDKNQYHELRYEALVAAPVVELQKISEFLQIPFSSKMARFFEGKTRDQPGLSAKSAWLPPTAGLRDWKTQMPVEDIAVFDGIAGELLDRTGYKRGKYPVSQVVTRRIQNCLDWWTKQRQDCRGREQP